MMNKYTLIMMGAGCLLAAACQAEPVRNIPAASSVQARPSAAPAGERTRGVQEHRRFKRLSLPLR